MPTADSLEDVPAEHRVYLGLGSNLGDRRAHLLWALEALRPFVAIDQVSSVYDTAPLLVTDQPRFLNIACAGRTTLEPQTLLRALKAIEREAGRTEGPRYGPRPLDIDILLYDGLSLSLPDLIIPHRSMPDRAFVLEPLAEIAPNAPHPTLHVSISTLLQGVDRTGVARLGPL